MRKQYILVDDEGTIPKGVLADLRDIPGLLLWHPTNNGHTIYAFNNHVRFVDTLNEAKDLVESLSIISATSTKDSPSIAIIEVDAHQGRIVQFCQIFTQSTSADSKKISWEESEINEECLAGTAFKDINEIYQRVIHRGDIKSNITRIGLFGDKKQMTKVKREQEKINEPIVANKHNSCNIL